MLYINYNVIKLRKAYVSPPSFSSVRLIQSILNIDYKENTTLPSARKSGTQIAMATTEPNPVEVAI